ncbi:MFS transporter [Ktedonobacter sp. SOSP1-52]|uniref:MFS transporter n=1 Tax=Ktedonobacter sp. SOSP1-52 TaxID=2778366 RepID=UPI0019156273|nr:MFS transporter [Ktedonobacter sp. SOSP1-52]GHO64157.1 MFS transporter [Ktedonobacter sp. SOSP1-52]
MIKILQQRNFIFIWSAGLISILGDYALIIALPLQVYLLTGSALATAAIFIANYLPGMLLGSIAGVFVDCWNRKSIMVWTTLARAAVLLPLILVRSSDCLWLLYLSATAESAIGVFFMPAQNALVPQVVKESDLIAANSLNALNINIARLVGTALGGLLFTLIGLIGVVLIDSITYLVAGLLISLITMVAKPSGKTSAVRELRQICLWKGWIQGFQIIVGNRTLILIFIVGAAIYLAEGIFNALGLAPFVLKVLGGSAAYIGFLPSVQAAGGLIGGTLLARFGKHISSGRLLSVSAIVLGLLELAIFNAGMLVIPGLSVLVLPLIFSFLAGCPEVATQVTLLTLMQSSTSDVYRGRVFGSIGTIQSAMMIMGILFGGIFGDHIGIVQILSVGAAIYILVGLITLWQLRVPQRDKSHEQ